MPILYALVYQDGKGHCEVNLDKTDIGAKVKSTVIPRVDASLNGKKTFKDHGLSFHVLVSGGIIFVCGATTDFKMSLAFSFLERISTKFFENRRSGKSSKNYKTLVTEEIDFYSNNPEADKLRGVKIQVQEVKGIMMENISKVLDRGDALEELEEDTDQLVMSSKAFKKEARRLKCALCQKKNMFKVVLIGVVFILVLVLIIIILWLFGVIRH